MNKTHAWVEELEGRRLMSVGGVLVAHAVRMETTEGRMTVELTPDVTPVTVANFLHYVERGLYTNTLVHRSVPGFVVQGGGYRVGRGYPGVAEAEPIVDEVGNDLAASGGAAVNVRGTIGVARRTEEDSGTSQWFVNLTDSPFLDTLEGGFAVFGRVIGGGMHTADAIGGLTVEDKSALNSALSELPVTGSGAAEKPVVVLSAKALDELTVTLDAKTKVVTWQDESGAVGRVTIGGGGTAGLKFVGSGLRYERGPGGAVRVTGKGVQLVGVAMHGTGKRTVLAMGSVGGKGPVHVGDVTADGTVGQIDGSGVWMDGDLTAAGAVGRVALKGVSRGTVKVGGGQLRLDVGTAVDLSVDATAGGIASLHVGRWDADGALVGTIRAGRIDSMGVDGGTFVGNVVVSGHVQGMVLKGGVKGSVIDVGSLGSLVAGEVETTEVRSGGDVGTVVVGGMKDSLIGVAVRDNPVETVNAVFVDPRATIGSVRVLGVFAGSSVFAPAIGGLDLGVVKVGNGGSRFGVAVARQVRDLRGVFGGRVIVAGGLKNEEEVAKVLSGVAVGDFGFRFVAGG